MVRRRPLPFPPEPLRTGVIQLTRNRLAAADRNDGRRGIWLRTLDRLRPRVRQLDQEELHAEAPPDAPGTTATHP